VHDQPDATLEEWLMCHYRAGYGTIDS
jgi:hypothetical protein